MNLPDPFDVNQTIFHGYLVLMFCYVWPCSMLLFIIRCICKTECLNDISDPKSDV